MVDAGSGQLQPWHYVQGLAAAAARAGARLCGRSPVRTLERVGEGWRLASDAGALTVDSVVLATNGYTGDLLPALRRSIVPVISAQIASEPLPQALAAAILPGERAASDTRRLLVYWRKDAAGRFVIGGRGAENDWQLARAFARLKRIARHLYPALAGIAFPYHWGGRVALTTDHLPHLHAPAPGLLAALGYNGRGVAMATAMGEVIAMRLTGTPDAALPVPVTPLRPIPLHALRGLGIAALGAWYRLRDRV
jgi:glycine/D-amino acid oxidase-like deaminating enzyme